MPDLQGQADSNHVPWTSDQRYRQLYLEYQDAQAQCLFWDTTLKLRLKALTDYAKAKAEAEQETLEL